MIEALGCIVVRPMDTYKDPSYKWQLMKPYSHTKHDLNVVKLNNEFA
jgi:hypothetical protein